MSTTTRRAVLALAGAAAMPALAVPAIAKTAEPDPILALINAHQRAVREHRDAERREAALVDIVPPEKRRSFVGDTVEDDDPRWLKAYAETGAAADLTDRIALQLVEVAPTTTAGAVALLQYACEFSKRDMWPDHLVEIDGYDDGRDDGRWSAALFGSLADALAAIGSRQAGSVPWAT